MTVIQPSLLRNLTPAVNYGHCHFNYFSVMDLVGNPDFVKLAQAYGVKAWRIRRPSDIDRILRQAHEYDEGPCVVVAEVAKEDNVFPMIPSGAPLSGMIIEEPREKLAKPTGST